MLFWGNTYSREINRRAKLIGYDASKEMSRTVRVLIRSASLVVLSLFVSASYAQTQPGTQKPAQKPPSAAPAQSQKAPAKEPEQEETISPSGPDALFPAVVARVNGKAILGRDLEQRIQGELSSIGSPAWKNLREDYRQELTNQHLGALVANELIYQKASAAGIKAADAEVQAEFTKLAKTYPSDAEMNMALANRGTDRAALSKDLARGLVVSKFIEEEINKRIVVSPADAQQYYSTHTGEFRHPDLVRTSHILIAVAESATADQDKMARQRAQALLARAKKGEDFAKLAKENSMDASASQGGDVGLATSGQLAPEYEQAAFSLPVGGISGLVRTQFGYHIIKVTDKKSAGISTLDEVRSQLIDFLKGQKAQAELQKYVNDLRTKAKIELFIPVGTTQTPGGTTASSPRP
jgi:peptidyl-prolyl cis-trans isomerase C